MNNNKNTKDNKEEKALQHCICDVILFICFFFGVRVSLRIYVCMYVCVFVSLTSKERIREQSSQQT
jgi:diacylglycerol kinase